MAISRKPKQNKDSNGGKNLIESIINKGGSSPMGETQPLKKGVAQLKITVRLPIKVIQAIDSYVGDSMSITTRNQFIKEAIAEKLDKLQSYL